MEQINTENFRQEIVESRNELLKKVIEVFHPISIETHLVGSLARGNSDYLSDIDFWVTIPDSKWEEIKEKRFDLISQVGNVIHLCEPPQNAPVGGIFCGVKFKQNGNLVVCDLYLCPMSTSFITSESQRISGNLELPLKELELNPQKIPTPDTYRIDFFISFIFGAIKLIARNKENSLGPVLDQYQKLIDRDDYKLKPIDTSKSKKEILEDIISNIEEFAVEKQKIALNEIRIFISRILK